MNRLFIPLICSLLFLSACESTPSRQGKNTSRQQAQRADDIPTLLNKARKAKPSIANDLRLQAADLAWRAGDYAQSADILAFVTALTSNKNQRRFVFLQVKINLELEDGANALAWLNHEYLMSSPLPETDQIQQGRYLARAHGLAKDSLASAKALIQINPLLGGPEQIDNQEQIFTYLMLLPAEDLGILARQALSHDLRGWLSLAALSKQTRSDPDRQLFALQRWQKVWTGHPGAEQLPASLQQLAVIIASQPRSIALFLPLSGKLAIYGQAIRDGIIATRFQLGSHVAIHIFDTNKLSVGQLLGRANRVGAEMAIGPLARNKVDELLEQSNLPFPILALNRSRNAINNSHKASGHAQVYQFGLAPEDEMVQVADRVYAEGKRHLLALFPDSEWGDRNYKVFSDRWQVLGGNTLDAVQYEDQKDYSKLIKALLDVDQSQTRAKDLRRIIGKKLEFTPRRRQDIDSIFLLGNQTQARRINPTLAFYYAEDIPVYSTSHVYETTDSLIDAIDLNGIRFCDMPWKLTDDQAIAQQIKASWQAATGNRAPFYALGVDAFRLHPRLSQMSAESRLFGATGILNLNENNVIERSLMWGQFVKGKVVTSPIVVEENLDEPLVKQTDQTISQRHNET